MKTTHLVAILALGLVACGKSKDKETPAAAPAPKGDDPAPPAPAKKSGRSIPNGQGLVVDAPATWLDNGIGGAAGMHLDNDGGGFSIMETSLEEAAKTMEAVKKDTEEILFKKWISSKKTADGFELVYVQDKMEMKGEEMVKAGTTFAFNVQRKIGGKLYRCSGPAATEVIATEGVALCNKVAAE